MKVRNEKVTSIHMAKSACAFSRAEVSQSYLLAELLTSAKEKKVGFCRIQNKCRPIICHSGQNNCKNQMPVAGEQD